MEKLAVIEKEIKMTRGKEDTTRAIFTMIVYMMFFKILSTLVVSLVGTVKEVIFLIATNKESKFTTSLVILIAVDGGVLEFTYLCAKYMLVFNCI